MSKKSYQSLQSSLPKAVRAPFSDYNSSCYNFLALWPCIRASVSGLGSELGDAKFLPGEIYLRAIDEVRKLRHQQESHMKVDGVVQIEFSEIELLSMEVTGHHGLHDKNRAGWDHIKGMHAALAMLSRIAYVFMHGSVELFQDVKVAFVHAHAIMLLFFLIRKDFAFVALQHANSRHLCHATCRKSSSPAKFGEALLLCELINFLWTLRVEISKTVKAMVMLKESHEEKTLGIKLRGEKCGQFLYEVLRPMVVSKKSKIVTTTLDKKTEFAGVGEGVLPGSSPIRNDEYLLVNSSSVVADRHFCHLCADVSKIINGLQIEFWVRSYLEYEKAGFDIHGVYALQPAPYAQHDPYNEQQKITLFNGGVAK
ncbi:hypothetical protein BC938DRAFT_474685 [Jimgerdemannia flammicorona]|uniref:Uncharacterized protein n=1 Tax=Jimgerdemannia flammicorona TaxID=994334 RepID=A0A433QSA5_9FUNG|nr:hypothetical protein BC938DRAFT_474685 [Jimgerdemannia flammicorona]